MLMYAQWWLRSVEQLDFHRDMYESMFTGNVMETGKLDSELVFDKADDKISVAATI